MTVSPTRATATFGEAYRPTSHRALFLHTTCCYFQDNLRLNAELDAPLAQLGIEVVHVLTDGCQCTYKYHLPDPQELHCDRTRQRSWRYLRTTKKKVWSLDTFAEPVCEGRAGWDGDLRQLEALNHRGLRLWPLVQASVVKALQWEAMDARLAVATTSEITTISAFLDSAVRYVDAIDAMLAEVAPTHLLLFSGMFYLERIAGELARRQGVRTIATESCCFFDRKYFDTGCVVGNRHSYGAQAKHQIEVRHLGPDERARLSEFLRASYEGANNFIGQPAPAVRSERDRLGIASGARVATFWGQVPSDSVLVYDSPLFDGQLEAIDSTVDLFRGRPGWHLVVRLHPGREAPTLAQSRLDASLESIQLPPNVSLVCGHDLNTYDLMRESDIGITVCSQAGLEMLGMHKRVVVLGNAFYSGLGFTVDVRLRTAYAECLRWALENRTLTLRELTEVDAFLFGLIFEHLVPVDRAAGRVKPEAVDRVARLFL